MMTACSASVQEGQSLGRPAGGDQIVSLPPTGVTVSVLVIGMVAGAAVAKLLHDVTPALAWLTGAALCGGLFGLARLVAARTRPSPSRFLGLGLLWTLAVSYLTSIGLESAPRPSTRTALGLAVSVLEFLLIFGSAIALPSMLAGVGLGFRREANRPRLPPGAGPRRITLALGAATFVVWITGIAVATWAIPPPWRLAVLVFTALASPFVMLPLAASAYESLLARRQSTRLSEALSSGLDVLRDCTGFVFGRVLCLDATFAGAGLCQVLVLPWRSTLILSESIPAALTGHQLLALLAHEEAHVLLGHQRRKIAWGVIGGIAVIATAVAAGTLLASWIPRAIGVARPLIVVLPIAMLRGFYDTFVVRRHEAEADDFAVSVAGAPALLGALETLGANHPRVSAVHNRWTTHSIWERRAARIRERDRS